MSYWSVSKIFFFSELENSIRLVSDNEINHAFRFFVSRVLVRRESHELREMVAIETRHELEVTWTILRYMTHGCYTSTNIDRFIKGVAKIKVAIQ